MSIITNIETKEVDTNFDVQERFDELQILRREWLKEDKKLDLRLQDLDLNKKADAQKAVQIAVLRRRLELHQVRRPLEPVFDDDTTCDDIRNRLIPQYARLLKEQRLFWLTNLKFIMTPDFRDLADKISWICQQQAFGQHRNFLLGGPSGNGKTTFFNALAAANLPSIGDRYNRVPIVKIDAQVNQKSSKALLSQMILGTGANYLVGDSEEDLINKIIGNFEKCGVVLLLVDEVEHMTEHSMRRRLLEVSNRTRGVSIICASCNPHKFTESDTEIEGRWRDYYELEPWITRKTNDLRPGISDLLGIIEMFLPFTERSQLDVMELTPKTRKKDAVIGPAQVILNCTRGILRDIMMLIYESSVRAINKNEPNLTTENLISTWDSICRAGKK